jgi:hypothetical protein
MFQQTTEDDSTDKKCIIVTRSKAFEANLVDSIGTDVFVNLDSTRQNGMTFLGKASQRLLMEQLVYLPDTNNNANKEPN